MDYKNIDIHELLPQREPFIMVSHLLYFDSISTITNFRIKDDNIFVDNGVLSTYGITENIAQTCASRIGYYNKYILKKDITVGYIGAIRKLVFMRQPEVEETLVTEIRILEEIFGMSLVEASVKIDDKLIASCEMKIAIATI